MGKNKNKTPTTAETTSTQTTAETSTNAEKTISNSPVNKPNSNTDKLTEPNPSTQQAESTGDVRVSPYGFGPYPEIPADYPIPPGKFEWKFWGRTEHGELMSRVRIKLWNQGIKSEGATFVNGKVYPIIKGTVYVEWDGNFPRGITGHPDDDIDAIDEALEEGKALPEGITVLDRNEAGINPYTFLELNQKE